MQAQNTNTARITSSSVYNGASCIVSKSHAIRRTPLVAQSFMQGEKGVKWTLTGVSVLVENRSLKCAIVNYFGHGALHELKVATGDVRRAN